MPHPNAETTDTSAKNQQIHPKNVFLKESVGNFRQYIRHTYHSLDRQILVFSIVMRLPPFMIALATLLLMAHQTGEVTLGAYAAGIVALSTASNHRSYRWLAQRMGYRLVLLIATTLNIPAVAFLMIQAQQFKVSGTTGSIAGLLLSSLVAGLTTAPLGSIMRLFWGRQFIEKDQRGSLIFSSALESILDVIALPAAAAIVGMVSILGGIQSSLFAVIVINVLGIMFMTWKPTALEPIHKGLSDTELPSNETPTNTQQFGWLPMLGASFLGIAIGATQSSLVIRAVQTETLETVGMYLGFMGAAGALTCLALVVFFNRFASWEGWLLISFCLVMSSLTLSLPQSSLGMVVALTFFGCAIGAGLMCMDTLVTRLSAQGNVVLAHSSTQSSYIGGLALGYVWAALLNTLTGQSAALLVPLVAATFFFGIGHLFGHLWRKRYEERLRILKLDEKSLR